MADTTLTDSQGRDVLLRDSTWERHILVEHPELAPERSNVEAAVADPIAIHESADPVRHPTGIEYYGVSTVTGLMVKVATEEALTNRGIKRVVKTAHYVKRVSGGNQLWP